VWWEFNKDELLPPAQPDRGPVSGSDEFFLGERRSSTGHDHVRPSAIDRRDRIAPALAAALQDTENRDVVTACLVALAKVGFDPPGLVLSDLIRPHLRAKDQEVRETAALALGIAGKAIAQPHVMALLADTSEGRKLAGGLDDEVPDRTRTFAAWSLGLLAGSADAAHKKSARDLLVQHLQDPEERSRDLRVGLVHGLGLLAPARSVHAGGDKLLVWQVVGELWKFHQRDLGKGNQLVQAHAPIAIARLLGRGVTPEHERAKTQLVADLSDADRSHHVRQSAALALGTLCLPREVCAADGDRSAALQRCYQRATDQLTRSFAVIALGRIGGADNRSALLSLHSGANKVIEKPWTALALGLIARESARQDGGAVDREVGELLLSDLRSIENDDAQSAFALAIGLCGHREAAPVLLELLRDSGRKDTLAGYLAVALAMLGHAEARDDLMRLMEDSLRRPFVLQQCALALGRLGDARTVPTLLGMLGQTQSTATLSAVAMALSTIKDRRSIDPLIAALRDSERTWLARAFAAAALGGVGDKDELPWNAAIARDMNYAAAVDTLTNGSTGVLDIL
jgi:HEAT repeat protein